MSSHTAEPWVQQGTLIWSPSAAAVVAQVSELRTTGNVEFRAPGLGSSDLEEIHANATRAVACVNALAGIKKPGELRVALEMAAKAWSSGDVRGMDELGDILHAAGLV